jgi:hypothetical protein
MKWNLLVAVATMEDLFSRVAIIFGTIARTGVWPITRAGYRTGLVVSLLPVEVLIRQDVATVTTKGFAQYLEIARIMNLGAHLDFAKKILISIL